MHAFYSAGNSMIATERKFGVTRGGLREIFRRRGLAVRTFPQMGPKSDPVTGRFLPRLKKTWPEIRALARSLNVHRAKCQNTIRVPDELKSEWHGQTMDWKRRVMAIIREEVPVLNPRPATPFSPNVTPWEYGTPAAHAIMDRLNAGRSSRNFVCRIWTTSCGVIHQGALYFWIGHSKRTNESTGYASGLHPRRLLHHVIWQQANGRPVPAKHTVIFRDGNKNNFTPKNLALRSMADCALMNNLPVRLKHDPQNPVLLAKMKLRGERIAATRRASNTARERAQAAAMVSSLQNKTGGLLAALNGRSQAATTKKEK